MFPGVCAACAAIVLWVVVAPAGARERDQCARPSVALLAELPAGWPAFDRALERYFGSQASQAAVVSFGESRWNPGAVNGQYLGYFQMGAHERAVTGWSSDAAGQVRAASLWNRMTGGRWARWSCRP